MPVREWQEVQEMLRVLTPDAVRLAPANLPHTLPSRANSI
jgi:hypothetical protein